MFTDGRQRQNKMIYNDRKLLAELEVFDAKKKHFSSIFHEFVLALEIVGSLRDFWPKTLARCSEMKINEVRKFSEQ